MTRFQDDSRVVAVIDPPEDGTYSSMGKCRVLKYVSNNAEKHFKNWTKDGILLVTSMPSMKKVVAMTQALWNNDNTPHPWQLDKPNTLEEKITEIEKRVKLVGPIPRLVFDSASFEDAIVECLQGAAKAAREVSDSNLYTAMRGNYTLFLAKHPASASSGIFFLSRYTVYHKTWKERRRHIPAFQLTPIATFLLRDRLEKSIVTLSKENFEDFAFDWLCEMEGRRAEIQYVAEGDHSTAYQRIASMDQEELRVHRPTAGNFRLLTSQRAGRRGTTPSQLGRIPKQ